MSEVVVDSSQSVDVLNEGSLTPLSQSGEEPGQATRPDDAVKSADEADPNGGQ